MQIFSSVPELDPVGFGLRAVAVGVLLWFLSRFLPRRSGGQYAGYDFTFYWMMGGLIVSPLYDPKINFLNTLTAVATVFFWHYTLSYIMVKSRNWARMVIGKPVTLIAGGKVLRQNMRRALMPLEMLLSELRTADAFNLAEVEMAVLETSGHLGVLKKSDHQPVTPRDLQIPTIEGPAPALLVNDGHVLKEQLHKRGYNEQWLQDQLRQAGARGVQEVYVASIDSSGQLSHSLKEPLGG